MNRNTTLLIQGQVELLKKVSKQHVEQAEGDENSRHDDEVILEMENETSGRMPATDEIQPVDENMARTSNDVGEEQEKQEKQEIKQVHKAIQDYERFHKDEQFGNMLQDVMVANVVLEDEILEDIHDQENDENVSNPGMQRNVKKMNTMNRMRSGESSVDLGKLSGDRFDVENMSEGDAVHRKSRAKNVERQEAEAPGVGVEKNETAVVGEKDFKEIKQKIDKMERDEKDKGFGQVLGDLQIVNSVLEEDIFEDIEDGGDLNKQKTIK